MHAPAPRAQRAELLGTLMDMVDAQQVLDFVADVAGQRGKALIANHNLHSLHLAKGNPEMAAMYEMADLIEIDSMPLVFWGRLMGAELSRANRSTYLDWRDQFWSVASERGWKVFYLGAAQGVAEAAAKKIRARWPGVQIATRHGYFDHAAGSADSAAAVKDINAFAPHVLMVGMGMPLQEVWIARNFHALKTGVVLPVGGAFDYEVGVQIPPPRFLGAIGLEWLFRLASQPHRLFHRYMIEPWALIGPAVRDVRARARGNQVKLRETPLQLRPAGASGAVGPERPPAPAVA
jgi:N-acetylglucosaminyldiphosphoundecaprenol N-acetyl-beta-D-mannosaminyltransferase